MHLCHTELEVELACDQILATHHRAMVERLIEGMELTVGLLEERRWSRSGSSPTTNFLTLTQNTRRPGRNITSISDLPEAVVGKCRELARDANRLIGGRDLAQVDMMLDRNGARTCWKSTRCRALHLSACCRRRRRMRGWALRSWLIGWRSALERGADLRPELFVANDPEVAVPTVDLRGAARIKRRPPARKTA